MSYGPSTVVEHTVHGWVLLPGWQHDPLNLSRRIPTAWPSVRPPQVGEQIQLPSWSPAELDVRTVTAVRWIVGEITQRHQRAAVGLAVEVGERVPQC